MALVRRFKNVTRNRYAVHGEVDCTVAAFVINGQTFLQLDTGGSRGRKLKGKTSQSIQFDRDAAEQLVSLLRRTFELR